MLMSRQNKMKRGISMLSIGTFSKMSNVTTKTLRYYDEIGLLKPSTINSENGYRYYDVKQLKTILLINKLKQYCFSLEEISEVLHTPYDDSILLALLKQKQFCIQEKIKHYNDVFIHLKKDSLNLERGIHIMSYLDTIPVKLVETQSKNVYFIRDKIDFKNYSCYMSKLMEDITAKKLTITGAPMTIFHDEQFHQEVSQKTYDVEIAIPVKEAVKGTREFSGCLCAMSTLKGAYSGLTNIYAGLKQWIEKEGYEIAASPYEVYITNPTQTAPKDTVTAVYFPVKK